MAVATAVAVAGRMLDAEGVAVGRLLAAGDLDGARRRVRSLVGRTTADIDEAGIARAVVESIAENTTDAVVAPALWAAVGGAPAVLAYRAANTLDAMVGHHTDRYERFGWASARLDDALNLVPARVAAAAVARPSPGRARVVLRAVTVDARRHPSPNSGVIEAAFAASLEIGLGGANRYGDRVEHRGRLGDGPDPTAADIARAVRLRRAVTLIVGAGILAVAMRPPSGRAPSHDRRLGVDGLDLATVRARSARPGSAAGVEAVEPAVPAVAGADQPGDGVGQPGRRGPVVDLAAGPLRRHEPGVGQHPEVLDDGLARRREMGRQLGGRLRTVVDELLEHGPAGGVTEDGEQLVERATVGTGGVAHATANDARATRSIARTSHRHTEAEAVATAAYVSVTCSRLPVRAGTTTSSTVDVWSGRACGHHVNATDRDGSTRSIRTSRARRRRRWCPARRDRRRCRRRRPSTRPRPSPSATSDHRSSTSRSVSTVRVMRASSAMATTIRATRQLHKRTAPVR